MWDRNLENESTDTDTFQGPDLYPSQCHNVNTSALTAPLAFCFSTEDGRRWLLALPSSSWEKELLTCSTTGTQEIVLPEGVFLQLKFFLIFIIAIMNFMKCVQTHRYMYIYWIHPALKLIDSRHTNAFKHITFYVCSVPFYTRHGFYTICSLGLL